MTSTLSKVKVTELLKFQKLHFSRSVSSAILAGSSKLMVDYDNMSEPDFPISFYESYHEFKLHIDCRYYTNSKWPYFHIA